MSTVSSIVKRNEAKGYINSIDFSDIIAKLVNQYHWQRKHALVAVEMYKNFLYLSAKYHGKHKLVPSEEIDEIWHLHILDTKNYRKDCDAIFGKYLDHKPTSFNGDIKANIEEMAQSFNKMLELYSKEFHNAELYQIRGGFAKCLSFIKGAFKQIIS